jgi:acyl-CoA reductase-like NAD-dependent aldehyde dehydrogenase
MVSVAAVEAREPAAPERVIGRYPRLAAAEVDRVLAAAGAAQPEWARVAAQRAAALHGWAGAIEASGGELADLVAREVGKPIREARSEVARAVAILRFYAQAAFDPIGEILPAADGIARLSAIRLPLGVVAAVTPWNFPLAIPAWKIGPALAYGNAVVFKPASAAIAIATRLVELAAGHVPADVLSLANLDGADTGRLLDDLRLAGVSFTGSVETGRALVVRLAERGAAVQAEMGGQNPAIVLDDADLDLAADLVAEGAMGYAGQKCTATSRVIVHAAVADRFSTALIDRIRAMPPGDPLDESTRVGPLISEDARESVSEAISDARRRGAALIAGGTAPERDGWFLEPTLLRVEDPGDRFVQEEVFGPAAAVLVAASDEEALRIANGTRYGLVGAVFGTDLDRAQRVAERLETGLVRVNAPTTGVDFHAPFGGERASSYGPREQGRAAREFYTKTRTVLVSPPR